MPKKLLVTTVIGEPSGFLLAALFCILGLVAATFIAVDLPAIQSFREIAVPSVIAIIFGALAAIFAVRTSQQLDDGDCDSRL